MLKRTFLQSLLFGCFSLCTLYSQAELDALCAEVKIEIKQTLTLERQGFEAVMRINNALEGITLEDINIQVNFEDSNNQPVFATSDSDASDAAFYIRVDHDEGFDSTLSHESSGASITDGELAGSSVGEIRWLIIPTEQAVGDEDALFYVGATLSYSYNGIEETVDVAPDFITVKPLPDLLVEYFLTRDVFGDNPLTDQQEAVEPYTLGVRITNQGGGTAVNMKLDSAQPEIVDNEQNLLIDFELVSSFVNDGPVANTLALNFGDVLPGTISMGRWVAETSLTGEYTDFNASYSHADELGGELTSLIDSVTPYFLVKDVLAPDGDSVLDYLAYTTPSGTDVALFESEPTGASPLAFCHHCSPVTRSTAITLGDSGTTTQQVIVNDPQPGLYLFELEIGNDYVESRGVIDRVIRSDGQSIAVENTWFSKKRTSTEDPKDWSELTHFINIFDKNPSAHYTLYFKAASTVNVPPELAAIADQVRQEQQQMNFFVRAMDPNGTTPTLQAIGLPVGASFTDEGDGTGLFRWSPALGQDGRYAVEFIASDGVLHDTKQVALKVIAQGRDETDYNDNDGDGYTKAEGDWDDNDPDLYPGAPETCSDGIDQDGDGFDMPCLLATGDVDGDGIFTAKDILLAQQQIFGMKTLNQESIERGDLYPAIPDGQLTTGDLLKITRVVLENLRVSVDTDHDLLPDYWENSYPDADVAVSDAAADSDGDGLSNAQEYFYHTNPGSTDSDGDGFTDDEEVRLGSDPAAADAYPTTIDSEAVTVAGVGRPYRYTLNSNTADANFELVSGPVGMTLVSQQLQWEPGLSQLGSAAVIVRAVVAGMPSIDQSFAVTVYQADGDMDDDGVLSVADVLMLQRWILGAGAGNVVTESTNTPNKEQVYRGDLYPVGAPDGQVNISDLLILEKRVLGGQ